MAAPALGVAGLSLSLASGAYGARATLATDMLSSNTARTQEVALHEEEVFDVSLAAFNLLDRENAGTPRPPPGIMAWGGGCVPDGLYYSETPPAIGRPVYQPTLRPNGPRPIRPAHKHAQMHRHR
jgi:hypothetical protein